MDAQDLRERLERIEKKLDDSLERLPQVETDVTWLRRSAGAMWALAIALIGKLTLNLYTR